MGLTAFSARPRHPTVSNTTTRVCCTPLYSYLINFLQTEHYQHRVRARDPCCLISGIPVVRGDFSRFKAAHVYPRAHSTEVYQSYYIVCSFL